jgi:hypothetical protein
VAQNSWPSPGHNDRNVTDTEYEKIASRFSDDGMYGTPADTAVISAGVGLSVDVRADVHASVRGHAWTSGTTTVNLAIAANVSGLTRIDRVVLRLDRSDWTVRAVVKEGTPGSGVPTLSQQTGDTGVYEIALAEVTILSGAGSVTVVRKELYIGSRVRPATSTTRNPIPAPGELAFETNTGIMRLWTGSSWSILSSSSGIVSASSPLSAWSIVVEPVLELRNGSVHLRLGQFKRTAGALDGATDSRLPVLIPSAYRHPTRNQYVTAYITGAKIGRITVYSSNTDRPGQVWLTQKPDISTGNDVLPGSASWVVH